MERTEWLKKMRAQDEALYDHIAPAYWAKFDLDLDATHRQFLERFLSRLDTQSAILDAACGGGLYDAMLLDAGHTVLGIDQSDSSLARAREHFPQERFPTLRYEKIGLQEMGFQARFDGAICIDALEHIPPEDWPDVVARFHKALKPDGVLYITVCVDDQNEVRESYERARAMGLPVVFGEVVDQTDAAFTEVMALDAMDAVDTNVISGERLDEAVYHFYPPLEQVRAWLDQAGFILEEEGIEGWYAHFLVRQT